MNTGTQRLLLCLLGGVIAAAICTIGRLKLIPDIPLSILLASGVGNRLLIGFVLGVSRWKTHFILHSALVGLIVTLSYSIGMIPGDLKGFFVYTTMGVLFGIMIETLATKAGAPRSISLKA